MEVERQGEGGRWKEKVCGEVEVSLIETSGWRRVRERSEHAGEGGDV